MAVRTKRIVIFAFQNTLITRGLENNLEDAFYHVVAVVNDLSGVLAYAGKVDTLLIYLTDNAKGNKDENTALRQVLRALSDKSQSAIVIGDSSHHDDLEKAVPELHDFVWLDRPLDIGILKSNIDRLSGGSELHVGPKKKILLVDDDPTYAKTIREWIKDEYNVSMVTDGMQAIRYLNKAEVDLILLDYEMPVLDGPKVFEMLSSNNVTKHIPVIFLTGVGTRAGVTRVMALKPAGYLLKTSSRDDILDKIRDYFASR